MKRFLALIFSLIFIASLSLPSFAIDNPPEVEKCQSAYLYSFANNRVLYEYNPEKRVYPTSTVKIMTGLLALEHFAGALDTEVTVTKEMLSKVKGNKLSPSLTAGEVVTVEQMLYGCLVGGANDAAYVLAYATSGNVESFITDMNAKAALIGAYSTKYTNPTGMHDDAMYTTARDTAQIAIYAQKNEDFARIVKTSKYVMEKTDLRQYRDIYNRNAMISKFYAAGYYDERAVGINAGATSSGGYCTVQMMTDSKTNLSYLAVVMGAEENEAEKKIYSYENAKALLDWAFASFTYTEVLSTDKVVCEIPVSLSSAVDYVTLQPKESLMVYLPSDVDLKTDITIHYTTLYETLAAPVKSGDIAGQVTVMYNDEILGTVDLITTADISRSEFLYMLSQIEEFTKSKGFIAFAVSAVVLSIGYVLIQAFRRGRAARRL